jgi:hypothetical protein
MQCSLLLLLLLLLPLLLLRHLGPRDLPRQ